ncbi:AAA family ATPase [Paenibacillus sp. SZ31]|uniref:ParA family protein n=1 Tax=Paenibacillus sp. SZ31 TaxID=2725555 RepID=UPI00146D8B6F|nr:ParA family protein [Paenibacillus sp. SZ31]NMI05059.1 AAA family ATPase [Paenibacillus sp. SZ31]
MGHVISFLNMKGGVGKTTLCREIAYYLQNSGKKVLVVDVDPQSNCTQSLFEKFSVDTVNDEGVKLEGMPTIQNMYESKLVNIQRQNVILKLTENLSIIPGDLSTVFMEREVNSKNEQRLLTLIDQWELKREFDYIFIDCPPTYSFYTVSALLASDFYLAPAQPDLYSILGLDLLNNVVENFKNDDQAALMKSRTLLCLGVVLTKVDLDGGVSKIISSIDTFARKKGLYRFKQEFKYMPKIATSRMDTFVTDRNDALLLQTVQNICEEFEGRIDAANGQEKFNQQV